MYSVQYTLNGVVDNLGLKQRKKKKIMTQTIQFLKNMPFLINFFLTLILKYSYQCIRLNMYIKINAILKE